MLCHSYIHVWCRNLNIVSKPSVTFLTPPLAVFNIHPKREGSQESRTSHYQVNSAQTTAA